MSDLKVYSLRLTKGAELKQSLINYAKEKQLSAPFVLTCCGSLSSATLRYASQKCGGAENVSALSFFIYFRDGSSGWAGWEFSHPAFQRSEAKDSSKLQNSCNLYVPTVDVVKNPYTYVIIYNVLYFLE